MGINIDEELKNIEIENIIWVIYLFIIGANFISNYFVEKYLFSSNYKYKKIYRTINIIVLIIALIIYIYFAYLSYQNEKKDKDHLYQVFLFIASILITIGGIIYLSVEIYKNANPLVSII